MSHLKTIRKVCLNVPITRSPFHISRTFAMQHGLAHVFKPDKYQNSPPRIRKSQFKRNHLKAELTAREMDPNATLQYVEELINDGVKIKSSHWTIIFNTIIKVGTAQDWVVVSKMFKANGSIQQLDGYTSFKMYLGNFKFRMEQENIALGLHIKESGFTPSFGSCFNTIYHLFLVERYDEVVKFANQYYINNTDIVSIEAGINPKVLHHFFNSLILSSVKMKDLNLYNFLQEEMRKVEFRFDMNTRSYIGKEMLEAQMFKELGDLWYEFRSTELPASMDSWLVLSYYIRGLGELDRKDECFEILDYLESFGLPIIPAVYTSMLKFSVEPIVERMKKHCQPNDKFYIELLRIYIRVNKGSKVKKILKCQPELSTKSWNVLLCEALELKHLLIYQTLLDHMKEIGKFDGWTTSINLNRFALYGQGNLAEIIQTARTTGLETCPSSIVRALSHQGYYNEAREYWRMDCSPEKMENVQLAFCIGVDSAGFAQDLEWLQEILNSYSHETLDQNCYNSIIEAYYRLGLVEEALNWTERMIIRFDYMDHFEKSFGTIGLISKSKEELDPAILKRAHLLKLRFKQKFGKSNK